MISTFPFFKFLDTRNNHFYFFDIRCSEQKPYDGTVGVKINDQVFVQEIEDIIKLCRFILFEVNLVVVAIFNFCTEIFYKPDIRLFAIDLYLVDPEAAKALAASRGLAPGYAYNVANSSGLLPLKSELGRSHLGAMVSA